VVLNDGTNDYLSIVNRDTGYTIGGAANSALQVSESYTGGTGIALGLAVTDAANASFAVNGLAFTRRSNVVTDAVPGTTLTLKSTTAVAESLLQENDVGTTNTNLQEFVTAYNDVATLLQKHLAITPTTNRDNTLAGDSVVRQLRAALSNAVSSQVAGLADVRSLVDLGIKTSTSDGTLSIDNSVLTKALQRDANAVNTVFSTATVGIRDKFKTLVDTYTNVVDGVLTTRTKNLNLTVRHLDSTAAAMRARLDAYKQSLVVQFSAMEKIISGLKAAGNFLNGQQSSSSGGG
jgi:flagellar hook-associated protein 2